MPQGGCTHEKTRACGGTAPHCATELSPFSPRSCTLPLCLRSALLQAHPFDTEAGQAAFTSPFAAGALMAGGRSDADAVGVAGPAGQGPSPAASAEDPQHRQSSRQHGPHDSAGTRSNSSTLSRSSVRSYLVAKCARIETKSMHDLRRAASADLSPAAAGGAEGGLAEAAHPASALTAPAAARVPAGGRGSVEMQALHALSPEEAAEVAEGGDVVGGGLLVPLPAARRISSEGVSHAMPAMLPAVLC